MKPIFDSTRCPSAFDGPAQFCQDLLAALAKLKARLQHQFEESHPGRAHLIRQAVAEAEELAWKTPFPHLFMPDFAEVRLAEIVAAREPALARAT